MLLQFFAVGSWQVITPAKGEGTLYLSSSVVCGQSAHCQPTTRPLRLLYVDDFDN